MAKEKSRDTVVVLPIAAVFLKLLCIRYDVANFWIIVILSITWGFIYVTFTVYFFYPLFFLFVLLNFSQFKFKMSFPPTLPNNPLFRPAYAGAPVPGLPRFSIPMGNYILNFNSNSFLIILFICSRRITLTISKYLSYVILFNYYLIYDSRLLSQWE